MKSWPRRASHRSPATPGCRHCRRSARPGSNRSSQPRSPSVSLAPARHIRRDAAAPSRRRDRERRGRRRDRRWSMAMAVGAQLVDRSAQQRESVAEGREVGDLAADMHVRRRRPRCRAAPRPAIKRARLADRECRTCSRPCPVAILSWVLASTSGLTRIAIRRREPERAAATSLSALELGLALDIEAEDALLRARSAISSRGLADAGKDDLARPECRQPARGAIRPPTRRPCRRRASPSVASTAEIGVGLDRIADQCVQAGEGLGEHPVMPLERRRRIAIERRADGVGELGQARRPRHAARRRDSAK